MQSSFERIKQKAKMAKMKRPIKAFFCYQGYDFNDSFKNLKKQSLKTENIIKNQTSSIQKISSDNLSYLIYNISSVRTKNDSNMFSDENSYQPLSLSHRKMRTANISTRSYKNQKKNSALKYQMAKKYIGSIDYINIKSSKLFKNDIRFNEETKQPDQLLVFCPYQLFSKRKKLVSSSQGRSQVEKRLKSSPATTRNNSSSFSKTNDKNIFRIKQFSKTQFLNSPCILQKRSSISAWDVSQ